MAGTLPGVGVDSRRMRQHRRHDDPRLFREPPSLSERLQRSTTVTMAETALLARQRLDLKLARFRSSSRLAPFFWIQEKPSKKCPFLNKFRSLGMCLILFLNHLIDRANKGQRGAGKSATAEARKW